MRERWEMIRKLGYRRRIFMIPTWAMGVCVLLTALVATGVPASAKVYLSAGILGEPKNFNPFRATDAWTGRVIRLLYQPLYLIDPETLTLIPWLAKNQPLYDPQNKTLTFHLREMQWDDGQEFSAEDVVFTAQMLRKLQIPRYYEYWESVKKIEALDKWTVQLTVERETAIFYTRTLTARIVQKRRWAPVVEKADQRLQEVLAREKAKGAGESRAITAALEEARRVIRTYSVGQPVGLGPFRYEGRKRGRYIFLVKNDRFFGQGKAIAGQKLGPHIDKVIFKIYDSLGAASMALMKGDIDFLWKGVSHSLVRDLAQAPDIRVMTSLDKGYRYLGFNLRRAPMSDPAFRRATAYLIDKDYIIQRVVHGYGARLDTVIPPGNPFYFNPKTRTYGRGMERDKRVQKAYRILTAAGYRWKRPPVDAHGTIQKARGLTMPSGKPVRPLVILTPPIDYDAEMAGSGRIIGQWLKDFGIPVNWEPVAFRGLVQRIRAERDFDMFVLGWRNLPVDPDYLRRFFHSTFDRAGGQNDTGYRDPQFDRIADLQAKTMNFQDRRGLVLDLQSQLMMDLPYIPIFVPHRLEGVRTDRFEGWKTTGGEVGNIWTFCLLRPTAWWSKPHPLHQ